MPYYRRKSLTMIEGNPLLYKEIPYYMQTCCTRSPESRQDGQMPVCTVQRTGSTAGRRAGVRGELRERLGGSEKGDPTNESPESHF